MLNVEDDAWVEPFPLDNDAVGQFLHQHANVARQIETYQIFCLIYYNGYVSCVSGLKVLTVDLMVQEGMGLNLFDFVAMSSSEISMPILGNDGQPTDLA